MNLRSAYIVAAVCIHMQHTKTQDSINPQNWITTYITNSDGRLKISHQDLQATLNLFYLSFARSNVTLNAQDSGLHALQTAWQAFQNIIHLRLDPSQELPYPIGEQQYTNNMKALYRLQLEHRQLGTLYASAVENILNGTIIVDEQLKNGLQSIKDESRRAIANALSNVQEYIDTILNSRNDDQHNDSDTKLSKPDTRTGVGDYILALIPTMALNSFAKANDLTIAASEQAWKALYQLFNINNIIWKSVEHARASFYLAYYKALYLEAQSHNINMKSMTLMFHEHSLLEHKLQHTQLPHPNTLHLAA